MKILSFDPCSTKNCGWALLVDKQIIEVGKYTLGKINFHILDEIYSQTRSLILKHDPDVIVMEDSIGQGFAPTRKKIIENSAMIKLATIYLHKEYKEINTNQAFKQMIGKVEKGKKKKQTIEYINEYIEHSFDNEIKIDEHIADAILLGLYYETINSD